MAQLDDLTAWAVDEQISLWYDLSHAIDQAVNSQWSMGASNVARRIVAAARLVGPSPTGEIPWALTAGGVYHAVLTAGEVPHDLPDEAEMQRVDDLMARNGARSETRAAAIPRYAGTVSAINTDRERAYIRDDDDEEC